MTRAIVEIELIENRLNLQKFHDILQVQGGGLVCTTIVLLDLLITVQNKSIQSANVWGINIKSVEPNSMWQARGKGMPLSLGVSERGIPHSLLPDDIAVVEVSLSTRVETTVRGDVEDKDNEMSHNLAILRELLRLQLNLRAVTQNYISKEMTIGCGTQNPEQDMLMEELLMRIDKAREGYRVDQNIDWHNL
jgi:hypothetical protein